MTRRRAAHKAAYEAVGQKLQPTALVHEAWLRLVGKPHDIPPLVAAPLVKPLGNPAPNGITFFAAQEILELAKDRSWLTRMTNATLAQKEREQERP
jgi:hypothetical protein